MHKNKLWCGALAAMVLAVSTNAGAAPPPPRPPASSGVDVAKARINAAVAAMDEISSSMSKLDLAAIRRGKTVAEMAAIMDTQVAEAQVIVDSGVRKLAAVQPLPGNDSLAISVNQVLTDARTFGSRVEAVLVDTRAASQALKAGDRAQTQKSLAAMSASAITLIDGQAMILRARKPFFEAGNSNRDQLEAMATVYDGTTFILKAGLGLAPASQTVAGVRDARDRVLAVVASGRAKLQVELAAAAKARGEERKAIERDSAYQARIFDSLVESATVLGRTADRIQSGDMAGVRAEIDALKAEESNQQNLIVEQFNQ
jgi:hypothetical protein